MKKNEEGKSYIAIILKHSEIQQEPCGTFEEAVSVLKQNNDSGQAYPLAIINGDIVFFPVDEDPGIKQARQIEDWETILKSAGIEYSQTKTFKLP